MRSFTHSQQHCYHGITIIIIIITNVSLLLCRTYGYVHVVRRMQGWTRSYLVVVASPSPLRRCPSVSMPGKQRLVVVVVVVVVVGAGSGSGSSSVNEATLGVSASARQHMNNSPLH